MAALCIFEEARNVWKISKPLPYRTRLVIGCGENHQHLGHHLQADTLDIDPGVCPDIVGNICDPDVATELYGRYRSIICECLPASVYRSYGLYGNLRRLRAPDGAVVFFGLTSEAEQRIRMFADMLGWAITPVAKLEDIPPHLYLDPDLEAFFRYVLAFSPWPGLLAT